MHSRRIGSEGPDVVDEDVRGERGGHEEGSVGREGERGGRFGMTQEGVHLGLFAKIEDLGENGSKKPPGAT